MVAFLQAQADVATMVGIVSAVVVPITGALVWIVKALFNRMGPTIEHLSASISDLAVQAKLDRQDSAHRVDRLCQATENNTVEVRRLSDRLSGQNGCSWTPRQVDLAERAHRTALKEPHE